LNGKPQASSPDFAYACGWPFNENAQYANEGLRDRVKPRRVALEIKDVAGK
jgi:hypothetical protein